MHSLLSVKVSGLPLGAVSSRSTKAERSALNGCATVVRSLAPGGALARAGLRAPCGFASINGASVRHMNTEDIRAACEAAQGTGLVLTFALPSAGVTIAGLDFWAGDERAAAEASLSAPATNVHVDDGASVRALREYSLPAVGVNIAGTAAAGSTAPTTLELVSDRVYYKNHWLLRFVPFPLIVLVLVALGMVFVLWLPVLLPAGLALSTLSPEHSLLALVLCKSNCATAFSGDAKVYSSCTSLGADVKSGAAVMAAGQLRAISVMFWTKCGQHSDSSCNNIESQVLQGTLPLLTPKTSSQPPAATPLTVALVSAASASDAATALFGYLLIVPMVLFPIASFLISAMGEDGATPKRGPFDFAARATLFLWAWGCFLMSITTMATTSAVGSAASDWARGMEPLQEAARTQCLSPASGTPLELHLKESGGTNKRFVGAGFALVLIGLPAILALCNLRKCMRL